MRISRRNVWGWNFSPQPPNWPPEIPNVCLPACLPFGSLGFLKLGNLNDHLSHLVKGSIQIKDFILFLKKGSQNSNDLNKHPKYGIKEPCVGFTIYITISLQGEVFGMRLPDDTVTCGLGELLFDNGSHKGLGAFITWCCLISLKTSVSKDDLDEQGQSLIDSLSAIPTMFKSKATLSRADNIIANVAKQDGDSRVQPVTSYTWSTILRSLATEGNPITFSEAIQRYNSHPDVLSFHKGEDPPIDKKKSKAIQNWLENCCEGAQHVVEQSQHTIPFTQGPFGEQLAQLNALFTQSTVSLQSEPGSLAPLDGEQSVSIDWQLPLSNEAQEILFKHIVARFEVDSAVVPMEKKKKYRAQADVLVPYRNCCALFGQLKPFLLTKLSGDEVASMQNKLETYQGCQDLQHIMTHRPEVFAISMLPSKKAQAQKSEEEKEQRKSMHLETKRVEVQASQWSFFVEALSNDQEKIVQVQKAPRKIKELQHLKAVAHRKNQESKAVTAVEGYMENFMRVNDSKNTAAIVKETSDFARYIVPLAHLNQDFPTNFNKLLSSLP